MQNKTRLRTVTHLVPEQCLRAVAPDGVGVQIYVDYGCIATETVCDQYLGRGEMR